MDEMPEPTIIGWVWGILNNSVNPPLQPHVAPPRFVRPLDVIERYDVVKVKNSALISTSSLIGPDDPFVVWILDVHKLWELRGQPRPDLDPYRYSYRARNAIFGGGGSKPTLDDAVRSYDRLRGQACEQMSLL